MIKINKKTEYALISLKHMVESTSELTTARELCELYDMPFDTTSKVLQTLHNHQILNSIKGVKGGYALSKNLSEITYLELSEIIEGKTLEMKCSSKDSLCEQIRNCNIITPVNKLNYQINRFFKNLTLEELLEPIANHKSINTQIELQQ